MSDETTRLPRDDLFRAMFPGIAVRDAVVPDGEDDPGGDAALEAPRTLFGHFAVFDTWTEINSWYEGRFLERLTPGAFRKTLSERGDQIRCLFQHGYDYVIGDKPLGPFTALREDETGLYYEVPLLDTSYNADLIPGLEAGLYGASFRFRVMREEMIVDPGVSDYNPEGLPERTIKEVTLYEGGPVTFGAYPEATAGMRSVTDEFLVERMARNPERMKEITEARKALAALPPVDLAVTDTGTDEQATDAPSDDQREAPAVESERRALAEKSTQDTKAPADDKATPKVTKDYLTESLMPPWHLS